MRLGREGFQSETLSFPTPGGGRGGPRVVGAEGCYDYTLKLSKVTHGAGLYLAAFRVLLAGLSVFQNYRSIYRGWTWGLPEAFSSVHRGSASDPVICISCSGRQVYSRNALHSKRGRKRTFRRPCGSLVWAKCTKVPINPVADCCVCRGGPGGREGGAGTGDGGGSREGRCAISNHAKCSSPNPAASAAATGWSAEAKK
jgi:hypothetical protein